jgi:NAD(P)-dependent dehydrogenase (short-subunit alcohol dehydrogenase family)
LTPIISSHWSSVSYQNGAIVQIPALAIRMSILPNSAYDRLGAMFMNMLPVDGTEPRDVADTVLFLASDESKFITAHEIAPDAGVTEF